MIIDLAPDRWWIATAILVLGLMVMSHIVEAATIILTRSQRNEKRIADQRLKRSIQKYRRVAHELQEKADQAQAGCNDAGAPIQPGSLAQGIGDRTHEPAA